MYTQEEGEIERLERKKNNDCQRREKGKKIQQIINHHKYVNSRRK